MCRRHLLVAACVASLSSIAGAESFLTPTDAGLVDVTKVPYNATPNDDRDDTAAIQRALDDHPNGNRIIYLPDGIYVVSDTLRWGNGGGGREQKRTILQGQSTNGVILRLNDAAPGYTDPSKPKSIIWTGEKPAQRFRNGIRTLTVETGRNNPGAVGVQYIANNQGSMRNVRIVSADGAGMIGLDLGYTDEQGPCLIKDVEVVGFEVGVSARSVVDSITIENLVLRGQRVVGLRNDGQPISIRDLRSENTVPAIRNLNVNGLIVLIGGELASPSPAGVAVENQEGAMLLRDVHVRGYARGVENKAKQGTGAGAPTGMIAEWVSHAPPASFETNASGTLRLPMKETPTAPQDPVEQWVGPHQFGGSADDEADDTEAVQKAIDSGRGTTLYFPAGGKTGWKVDGEVLVRGRIARVTALEGRILGKGTFKLAAADPPTVWFDRIDLLYQGVSIENPSDRTMVVSGITMGSGRIDVSGKGDLFLEDVCAGEMVFRRINVWATQLNSENKSLKLLNDGGRLWILGLKTEQAGTICETRAGGRTEILGGFVYSQGATKETPMFVVTDAAMTASVAETTWNKRNFHTILRETRGGETRELRYDKTIYWRNNDAAMLPLLLANPPAQATPPAQQEQANP